MLNRCYTDDNGISSNSSASGWMLISVCLMSLLSPMKVEILEPLSLREWAPRKYLPLLFVKSVSLSLPLSSWYCMSMLNGVLSILWLVSLISCCSMKWCSHLWHCFFEIKCPPGGTCGKNVLPSSDQEPSISQLFVVLPLSWPCKISWFLKPTNMWPRCWWQWRKLPPETTLPEELGVWRAETALCMCRL